MKIFYCCISTDTKALSQVKSPVLCSLNQGGKEQTVVQSTALHPLLAVLKRCHGLLISSLSQSLLALGSLISTLASLFHLTCIQSIHVDS